MFGSNPFGQSSSSPFGSQPGQTNDASGDPFGSPCFGQSGFGGQQRGSRIAPYAATPEIDGASSTPGKLESISAMLVYKDKSHEELRLEDYQLGDKGSSVFGQKPTFVGYGSNTFRTSPFEGLFQQSQPAFGSNLFGSSTPFRVPSQPAFCSSSSPAFAAPKTPTFGAASTPAFGPTASPAFGSTSGEFGASSSPFGSTAPPFGATSTPAFGASSMPAFGAASTPAFGASPNTVFGASSAPSFNFGSSPVFGQSTSAFGICPFGATSLFGAQSASFGAQTTTPTFGSSCFGQSAFGGQRRGSRIAPYSATPEIDGAGTLGKLESISAMQVYRDKNHEELRWEDYQLGDKGGPAPAGQAAASVGFGSSSTSAFGQSSANPFSCSTSTNPFAPKTPAFSSPGFGSSPAPAFGSSPFGTSNTSNLFGSTSSASSSLFGATTQAFGASTSPSIFSSASTSAFGSSSIFGGTSAPGTGSAFGTGLGFGNTQSSPLFQSTTPSLGQTSSPFGQTSSAFGQTTPGFGQSNLFSTPSTGFGGSLFSSTSSLLGSSSPLGFGQTTPSLSTPFQPAQPASSSGGFNFSNFGQSQAAGSSGFGGTPGMFGSSAFGQSSGIQSSVAAQAAPVTNTFRTLPAMSQMLINRVCTSPSIQYGIPSLLVAIHLFHLSRLWKIDREVRERLMAQRAEDLNAENWRARTTDLEKQLAESKKRSQELEAQLNAKVVECSRLDEQILGSTRRISELEEKLVRAESEAFEAKLEASRAYSQRYGPNNQDNHKAGVESSVKAFEALVPQIEKYGVYRFMQSPAFEKATKIKGANDFENGFKLCFAHVKEYGDLPTSYDTNKIRPACPDPRKKQQEPEAPEQPTKEDDEEPDWPNVEFGFAISLARTQMIGDPDPDGMPEPVDIAASLGSKETSLPTVETSQPLGKTS